MKNKLYYVLFALLVVPAISFAAPLSGLKGFIVAVAGIVYQLQYLVYGLAVLFFFEPAKHEEGRNKMIYGVLALFVMFSVFGIINWIAGTLQVKTILSDTDSSYGDLCPNEWPNC
jgi:hypothetical protein